jgi:hypothetical protein
VKSAKINVQMNGSWVSTECTNYLGSLKTEIQEISVTKHGSAGCFNLCSCDEYVSSTGN